MMFRNSKAFIFVAFVQLLAHGFVSNNALFLRERSIVSVDRLCSNLVSAKNAKSSTEKESFDALSAVDRDLSPPAQVSRHEALKFGALSALSALGPLFVNFDGVPVATAATAKDTNPTASWVDQSKNVWDLSVEDAARVISAYGGSYLDNCFKNFGRMLYRGGGANAQDTAKLIDLVPDMLNPATYGSVYAAEYFRELEGAMLYMGTDEDSIDMAEVVRRINDKGEIEEFVIPPTRAIKAPVPGAPPTLLPLPSNAHLVTPSVMEAARWGGADQVYSVWPLGDFHYSWLEHSFNFWDERWLGEKEKENENANKNGSGSGSASGPGGSGMVRMAEVIGQGGDIRGRLESGNRGAYWWRQGIVKKKKANKKSAASSTGTGSGSGSGSSGIGVESGAGSDGKVLVNPVVVEYLTAGLATDSGLGVAVGLEHEVMLRSIVNRDKARKDVRGSVDSIPRGIREVIGNYQGKAVAPAVGSGGSGSGYTGLYVMVPLRDEARLRELLKLPPRIPSPIEPSSGGGSNGGKSKGEGGTGGGTIKTFNPRELFNNDSDNNGEVELWRREDRNY